MKEEKLKPVEVFMWAEKILPIPSDWIYVSDMGWMKPQTAILLTQEQYDELYSLKEENERLKGLIETIVKQSRSIYPDIKDPNKAWAKFKLENNL